MGPIKSDMDSESVFSGNLSFFGLGDLIQLIGSLGSTGVLKISSEYAADPGTIYFIKGNPINATASSKTGLDALYSLFGWTQGTFEFWLENVQAEIKIHESRMQIILSGLKMLDDHEIDKLGPITIEEASEDSMVMGVSQPTVKGPLVDYIYVLDEEEFQAGDDIVLEGRHGTWLWVVLEGTIQIVKETPQGRVNIVRIGNGSFVGSIGSFLLGDYVRSASAVAVDKVLLGVLDSHRLSTEFGSLPPVLKGILVSLDNRLKQATDRAMDYYCNKNPLTKLNQKQLYIDQGDIKEKVVTIKQGRAYVIRRTKEDDVLLANLYQEDFIGHIPFIAMDHEPFSASVYGTKNLMLEEVDMYRIKDEYNKLSTTLKNLIGNSAACVSATSLMVCEFHKKHAMK